MIEFCWDTLEALLQKIDFNYKKKATVGGVFVSDCIVGKFPQTAG